MKKLFCLILLSASFIFSQPNYSPTLHLGDSSLGYWNTVRRLPSHDCFAVIVASVPKDTSIIYVGFDSTVTELTGIGISNGTFLRLDAHNTNKVHFVSSSAGANKVRWYYEYFR